jgi:hypothetical protein
MRSRPRACLAALTRRCTGDRTDPAACSHAIQQTPHHMHTYGALWALAWHCGGTASAVHPSGRHESPNTCARKAKQSKARCPTPPPATESTEFDSFMTAALRTTDVSFVADLAHPTMPRHGAASGRHPAKPKSIAPLTCAHHAAVLFESPRSGSVMHMRNGCKFPPSCAYRVTATAAQCEHRLHTCWLSIGCESESLPTGTAVPVLQDMLRLRIDTASLPMRPRACSST